MRTLDTTDAADESVFSARFKMELFVFAAIFTLLCVVSYVEYDLNIPNLLFEAVKAALDPAIPEAADNPPTSS